MAKGLQSFKTAIELENRNRFFRRNLGWFALSLALTAASVALVVSLGRLHDNEIGLLAVTGFVGVFAGLVLVRSVRTIVAATMNLAVLVFIGGIAATIIGTSGTFSNLLRAPSFETLLGKAFPIALVGGFALLNGLLRAPTAAGRLVIDGIEGLELYLRTAESARLNLAGAPEVTTERFERLLPYAVALGVEKPWSHAFEAAFARAHPGEDLKTSYHPAWHGETGWSGRSFGQSVAAAVSSAEGAFASAMPPPSSSSSGLSSGGGGGAGGGGGGGGGGCW